MNTVLVYFNAYGQPLGFAIPLEGGAVMIPTGAVYSKEYGVWTVEKGVMVLVLQSMSQRFLRGRLVEGLEVLQYYPMDLHVVQFLRAVHDEHDISQEAYKCLRVVVVEADYGLEAVLPFYDGDIPPPDLSMYGEVAEDGLLQGVEEIIPPFEPGHAATDPRDYEDPFGGVPHIPPLWAREGGTHRTPPPPSHLGGAGTLDDEG